MNKEDVIHIHTEYNGMLFGHKKEWNSVICHNVDGPRDIMLSEIRQRKTNTLCYHLYLESKKWM